MTRKEYLEKKNKAIPITTQHKITSLSEYLSLREQMEAFEQHQIVYTEEDFEAFDHNFLEILDMITFTGDGEEYKSNGHVYILKEYKSDVENCVEMMKSIDWKWNEHTPDCNEFVKTIRKLYEGAMEASLPRYEVSQCGFHLIVDIYNHRISLTWGKIECEFSDIEE